MTLSLRNVVGIRYNIPFSGNFSIKNVLSRARHDFGQGIARTANGISLRLLLEALRVYPPGIPTHVTAVAGDAQATVFWQAPSSDGGSPIFEYNIAAWDARTHIGIFNVTTTDGNARSTVCCRTPLTNGVPYFFRVWATNAAGDGFGSDSNTVTPMHPMPQGIQAIAFLNCTEARHTIHIWVFDATAGTGWQEKTTLDPQWDENAHVCPYGGATAAVVELTDGHQYTIRAVDPNDPSCGGVNDPTKLGCVRNDIPLVTGGRGIVWPVTVS